MELRDAIKVLKLYQYGNGDASRHCFDLSDEVVETILDALGRAACAVSSGDVIRDNAGYTHLVLATDDSYEVAVLYCYISKSISVMSYANINHLYYSHQLSKAAHIDPKIIFKEDIKFE